MPEGNETGLDDMTATILGHFDPQTSLEIVKIRNVSSETYRAIGSYITVVGILGVLGNGLVLFIMNFSPDFKKKSPNWLIKALACSDISLALFVYPPAAIASFRERWIFGDRMCAALGYLAFMFSMISMNVQVLVGITRYLDVFRPESGYTKLPFVRKCFVGCLLHAVVWTSLPLFGWNSYTYENFGTSCSINWLSTSLADRMYVMATVITCYAFQLTVVSFCYINIMLAARRLTPVFYSQRENMVSIAKLQHAQKAKREKTMTMISLAMILTFLILWTPYAVISICSMFLSLPLTVTILPTMFAKTACLANPLIYIVLSKRFRNSLSQFRLRTQPTGRDQIDKGMVKEVTQSR